MKPLRISIRLLLLLLTTALFSTGLFGGTALAVITINSPTPATIIAESHDFAMDQFGDPWDFSQKTDYRLEDTFNISNLNVSGGVISGRTTSADGNFFIHFPAYRDAWPIGRDGMINPINTGKYRYLSMRVYSSVPSDFWIYWFYNQTWTSLGVDNHFVDAGWNTIRIDLGSNPSWTGAPVGLRLDPSGQSGVDFQIDWIKLHEAPTASNYTSISWDDSSPGGTTELYLDNDSNSSNGNLGVIATPTSNATNTLNWDASDHPAGSYYIYARKSGVNSASAGSFEIRRPALLQILEPDEKGGEDYATAVTGDPWDMNSISDLVISLNIANMNFNGIFTGYNVNADPNFYLRVGAPINTDRYHRASFSMAYDPPFDFGLGSMSRFLWNPLGLNETTYQTSDDIVVYPDWTEYVMDLDKMKLDHGSIGWNGNMTSFRFDPLEIPQPRNISIDHISLRADDEAWTTFPITWKDDRGTFPTTNVSIYYDSDNSGYNGTQIASNVAQLPGTNVYNWDVTKMHPGLYYIYIVASDGVTTSRQYSSGPVKLYTNPTWDSGVNNWSWDASKFVAGDYNGDGIDDVAVLYGYKTERDVMMYVFTGDGQGGFNPPVKWWQAGAGNWDWEGSMLQSGDYNNDGRDDIAMLYGYKVQRDVRAFVLTSSGSNRFNSPVSWWQAGAGNWDWEGSKLTSGDFDGDGADDLAILYGYQTQRDVRAFVLRSNGSTGFNYPVTWFHAGPGNWDWVGSKLSSGDYNNDGRDDLSVLYGYQTERDVIAFVFPSTGSTFSSARNWWQAGAGNWDWSGSTVLSNDFNGDGSQDLAIFYNYGGNHSTLFTMPSNGVNRFSGVSSLWNSGSNNWRGPSSKVVAGNFNNNGLADMATLYDFGGARSGLFVTR